MDARSSRGRALVVALAVAAVCAASPAVAQARVANSPARSWQANGRVSAITIDDGVVYIGGSFTDVMPPGSPTTLVPRGHLAAFSATTGALLPWDPRTDGAVLVLKAIGTRIYVGGAFNTVDGAGRKHLAALSPTGKGALLPWHVPADGNVTALADLGTRLYVGGDFLHLGGLARTRLAAVSLTSGAVDLAWRPSANHIVHALAVDATTATVYAGGEFTNVSGHIRPFLVALTAARGGVGPWASAPVGRVWGLSLGPTQIFAAVGGKTGGEADAFARSGTLLWKRMADGDAQAIAYSKGVVFVGGHFMNACATNTGGGAPWVCSVPVQRDRLFAVNPGTGSLMAWNPGADSLWGVWALRATPTLVLPGGDFVHIGGVHQQGIARFLRF